MHQVVPKVICRKGDVDLVEIIIGVWNVEYKVFKDVKISKFNCEIIIQDARLQHVEDIDQDIKIAIMSLDEEHQKLWNFR